MNDEEIIAEKIANRLLAIVAEMRITDTPEFNRKTEQNINLIDKDVDEFGAQFGGKNVNFLSMKKSIRMLNRKLFLRHKKNEKLNKFKGSQNRINTTRENL